MSWALRRRQGACRGSPLHCVSGASRQRKTRRPNQARGAGEERASKVSSGKLDGEQGERRTWSGMLDERQVIHRATTRRRR